MAYNNTTTTIDFIQISKSIVDDLNLVTGRFINYLPLIFTIFGLTGFIGNAFTYLQAELRSNTCCIYSLCGSIIDIINLCPNLFPSYLGAKYGIYISWFTSSALCKLNLFVVVFLPHLSVNFFTHGYHRSVCNNMCSRITYSSTHPTQNGSMDDCHHYYYQLPGFNLCSHSERPDV